MAKLSDVLRIYDLIEDDLNFRCPRKIINKLAGEIIVDWDMVGRELGVSKKRLNAIRYDRTLSGPEEKAVGLLDAWTEEKGTGATCLKLAEALHRRKMTRTIEILCEMVEPQMKKPEDLTDIEYRTLTHCNQKLRAALQDTLTTLASPLLADDLITADLYTHLRDESRMPSERAARLVHFITKKVETNPSIYGRFLAVLRRDPLAFGDTMRILEDTYKKLSVSGAPTSTIPIDDLRKEHVKIMQLLDLSIILPLIQKERIIAQEDYDKVADTKHHGSVERTGYLLQAMYKIGQGAVDKFVRCLYLTKDENPRHSEILQLFEGELPDLPTRSPLFEILDENLEDIERLIEFTPFLKILLEERVIIVDKLLDLQSADRPIRENLERLIRALEEKGNDGFVKFMSCLQKEGSSTGHQHLFGLLFEKIKAFFKSHPKRGEVPQSVRIEILHMGARDRLQEKRVSEKFHEHRRQLEAEVQISSLMPYLQKQQVLSGEENERLREVEPERRSRELFELLAKKEPQYLVKFVECLEASPENKKLAALFAPPSPGASVVVRKLPDQLERHDKVAVMVQMEQYVRVTEDYQLEDKPFGPKISAIRGKLEQNLRNLGFTSVLYFKPSRDVDEEEEGQGSQEAESDRRGTSQPKSLKDRFREKVGEHCKDGAIVLIFVSGLQFPFEEKPKTKQTSRGLAARGKFSAAVLKDGASISSRRESECIRARDLRLWAESLPNAHVTFLIDTHQSHVAQFGKQRTTKVAEIMDDPWGELISPHSTTVVYYLRADSTAMAHQLGVQKRKKEEWDELGLLTDCFVSTLLNCYKRADSELSHRQVYEALSLYWHRKGRQHLLFVPAIQGDMDREFLGKSVLPYHQFFRADMPEPVTGPEQKYDFNLSKLQIATGSMSGLILNDQVEVFHILRPSVRAGGRVARANQLDCVVEVTEGKERDKLKEAIDAIYQDEDLRSKDGSTECLCVVKKYPLHQRFPVFTERLTTNDSETIKSYVKSKSLLLTVATNRQEAKLLVEPNGNYLLVKDVDVNTQGQVKLEVKSRDAQHVKIFLEMMAWYKHVFRVLSSSPTKPLGREQKCFLNAEKSLLSSAPPLCDDLQFKWSSYTRASEDRQCHSAILSFSEPMKFWSPSLTDPHPCLEVEFKRNHVVTTIELRGDSREEKYVKRADVWYQRDVYQAETNWAKGSEFSRTIDLSNLEEAVRFVTIVPQHWDKSFNLTFKIKKSMMSGATKTVVEIENLTVINWRFHQERGTGWKCIPVPDSNGIVSLDQALGWISWSGSTGDPITFDIGVRGANLEKIEFTTLSDTNKLQKFLLRMQTDWQKEEKTLEMTSSWPTKHEFVRPLVVSNLQVWPLETNAPPPLQTAVKTGPVPPPRDIRLQIQLYGNKQGLPLEVEEGRILAFYFSNFTLRDHYVYIFCFEETGNVKFVTWDIALHPYRTQDKTVRPSLKKLLQAYIPKGYEPTPLQIRDHYKILVSTRKMYLEPLVQRGLHDYRRVCSYNVCSLGRRGDFGPEPWYEHNFDVIVKKSPRR